MTITSFKWAFAVACCLCLGAAIASDPTDPSWVDPYDDEAMRALHAKGEVAQMSFAINGAEVNAFNFNFMVKFTEQVGFTVPVNGGLSLSVSRVYNSRYYSERPYVDTEEERRTYLDVPRQYPLGLGWEFHLGHIYEAERKKALENCLGTVWVYVASDGSEHDLLPNADGSYTSEDGSRLKATRAANGDWTVIEPSGRTLEFQESVDGELFSGKNDSTHQYYLPGTPGRGSLVGHFDRRVRGRYVTKVKLAEVNSWYEVTYHEAPFNYIIQSVHDAHSSAPLLETSIQTNDQTQPSFAHITEIHYPSFNGGSPAVFTFEYEHGTFEVNGYTHTVDLLARVHMPHNYQMDYTYRSQPRVEGVPVHGDWGQELETIRYPTGKLVKLEYGWYWYSTASAINWDRDHGPGTPCGKMTAMHVFETDMSFVGLKAKTEYIDGDASNTQAGNVRAWRFEAHSEEERTEHEYRVYSGCFFCHCNHDTTFFNVLATMTDPTGNVSEIIFDTSSRGVGFPNFESPEASATFATAKTETTKQGTTSIRTVDRTWEVKKESKCYNANWAVEAATKTTYLDDPAGEVSILVENTGWDGHHFQETRTSGNGVGQTTIAVTDYAWDNTSGAGDCDYVATLKAGWRPDVIASSQLFVEDGGVRTLKEVREYAFDPSTGRTKAVVSRLSPMPPNACAATLDNIVPRSGDQVAVYVHDSGGNVEKTTTYTHGAPERYITEAHWKYGVQERIRKDKSGLVPVQPAYYERWLDIDPLTRLTAVEYTNATSTTDASAVTRSFNYDDLRRTTSIQVGQLEPVTFSYDPGPRPGGGTRMVSETTTRGGADQSTESKEYYDTAGRVYKREKLMPDGTTRSYQHIRFTPSGKVSFQSEWTTQPDGATVTTGTTTDYMVNETTEDALGRPHKITGALGNQTEFSYFGTNKTITVKNVAGAGNVVTKQYIDGLGRLRAVDVASDQSQDVKAADAIYTYDYAGRLVRANLVPQLQMAPTTTDRYATGNALGQVRTFKFDALGRQTEAMQPESGVTKTLEWNALGAPTLTQDAQGVSLGHKHRTSYDATGRPLKVERVADTGADTVVQSWTASGFSTANSQACVGRSSAWYIGGATCQYAQSARLQATLTSSTIPSLPRGSRLAFEMYRQVRGTSQQDSWDKLKIFVRDASVSPADWQLVYAIDSKRISWSRWTWSPAIRLPAALAERPVEVRFEFDSVNSNTNPTVKGIAIGNVRVGRPTNVTLSEMVYDEGASATNRSRGKPTTVRTYDEGSGLVASERAFTYASPVAQLTKDTLRIDWDRDGTLEAFEGSYRYDEFGRVAGQRLPHPAGTPSREYVPAYQHGALASLAVDEGYERALIPGGGIQYNVAGGIASIGYGEAGDIVTTIEPNSAFLPRSITSMKGSTQVFASGEYLYDGARNIRQIGGDEFLYDHAQRLTWARVASRQYGTIDVDFDYDMYGNMLASATTPSGQTTPVPAGPAGLHFVGRKYGTVTVQVDGAPVTMSSNRIEGTDDNGDGTLSAPERMTYDSNGNLTFEPIHGPTGFTVGGFLYAFSPENRMDYVQSYAGSGEMVQESAYDTTGDRWLRIVASDGGQPLITLRDASGQVVADYTVAAGSTTPKLLKEYVHAAGRLIAIQSACGPRPSLALANPARSGTMVMFRRTDHITPTGVFRISIQSNSGRRMLTRPADMGTTFGIPESNFFPGQTNWVTIETTAACGVTGYSNAVSYVPEGAPTGGQTHCWNGTLCVTQTFINFSDLTMIQQGYSADMTMGSARSDYPVGARFNLYFQPAGTGTTVKLNPSPMTLPKLVIPDQPMSAGYGKYWMTMIDPVTHLEGPAGPPVEADSRNAGPEAESSPNLPDVNTQWVLTDHLGSTRAVLDEIGEMISEHSYYPFGQLAEEIGTAGIRRQFTGHERDEAVGLDYLRARHRAVSMVAFMSIDPTLATFIPSSPQSANRYSYVLNRPLALIDPDGAEPNVAPNARADLNTINTYLSGGAQGADTVNKFMALPPSVTVQLTADHTGWDPRTQTLSINPVEGFNVRKAEGGKPAPDGGYVMSPALVVFHEMEHGIAQLADPAAYAAAEKDEAKKNAEEERIIQGPETTAAKELEEPTREGHTGGEFVEVFTPTSRTPVNQGGP